MIMRAWIIGLAMLGLCPGLASAGLIFDLDGSVDGHRVEAAELTTDRLAVRSQGHIHAIQLPAGTGAYLMDWAQRDTGGPLVFSLDDSLVATDDLGEWLMQKRKSWPPSVPPELAYLIFHYDDYAHQVAC